MSLGQGREASGGVSRSILPPSELNKKRRDEIAAAAQAVLDALVDKAYGRSFSSDSDRVAHLFGLYAECAKSGQT